MNFPTGAYAATANDIRLNVPKPREQSPTGDDKPKAQKRALSPQAVEECTYGRSMRDEEQWLDETASVADLKRMLKETGHPSPKRMALEVRPHQSATRKAWVPAHAGKNTDRDRGIAAWDAENQRKKKAAKKKARSSGTSQPPLRTDQCPRMSYSGTLRKEANSDDG